MPLTSNWSPRHHLRGAWRISDRKRLLGAEKCGMSCRRLHKRCCWQWSQKRPMTSDSRFQASLWYVAFGIHRSPESFDLFHYHLQKGSPRKLTNKFFRCALGYCEETSGHYRLTASLSKREELIPLALVLWLVFIPWCSEELVAYRLDIAIWVDYAVQPLQPSMSLIIADSVCIYKLRFLATRGSGWQRFEDLLSAWGMGCD